MNFNLRFYCFQRITYARKCPCFNNLGSSSVHIPVFVRSEFGNPDARYKNKASGWVPCLSVTKNDPKTVSEVSIQFSIDSIGQRTQRKMLRLPEMVVAQQTAIPFFLWKPPTNTRGVKQLKDLIFTRTSRNIRLKMLGFWTEPKNKKGLIRGSPHTE